MRLPYYINLDFIYFLSNPLFFWKPCLFPLFPKILSIILTFILFSFCFKNKLILNDFYGGSFCSNLLFYFIFFFLRLCIILTSAQNQVYSLRFRLSAVFALILTPFNGHLKRLSRRGSKRTITTFIFLFSFFYFLSINSELKRTQASSLSLFLANR